MCLSLYGLQFLKSLNIKVTELRLDDDFSQFKRLLQGHLFNLCCGAL